MLWRKRNFWNKTDYRELVPLLQLNVVIPGWTQAHQAVRTTFCSSRCPSVWRSAVEDHAGSASSRRPRTLPSARKPHISHVTLKLPAPGLGRPVRSQTMRPAEARRGRELGGRDIRQPVGGRVIWCGHNLKNGVPFFLLKTLKEVFHNYFPKIEFHFPMISHFWHVNLKDMTRNTTQTWPHHNWKHASQPNSRTYFCHSTISSCRFLELGSLVQSILFMITFTSNSSPTLLVQFLSKEQQTIQVRV